AGSAPYTFMGLLVRDHTSALSLSRLVLSNGDVRVHFLLGVLIVIAPPADDDSQAGGHILDTLSPHSLVKLYVQAHVRGAHHLGGKLANLLHSLGSALFEAGLVQPLGEMNGVLTSHLLLAAALLLRHLAALDKKATAWGRVASKERDFSFSGAQD
ncbi:hypothetical protein Vretimale_3494, partial [Volvox reticuliferus]